MPSLQLSFQSKGAVTRVAHQNRNNRLTTGAIDQAREAIGMPGAVLISSSYLGYMTKEEFEGDES